MAVKWDLRLRLCMCKTKHGRDSQNWLYVYLTKLLVMELDGSDFVPIMMRGSLSLILIQPDIHPTESSTTLP